MSVYIDDMYAPFGRMKMCHMVADTTEQLNAMADKIGVNRKWIQHPGTPKEHYDVSMGARAKAVAAGAIEFGMRDYADFIRERTPNCSYKTAAGSQCLRPTGHKGACDPIGDAAALEDAR